MIKKCMGVIKINNSYEYFTVKEISIILKITEETVREKLRNKNIKGIKIGRQWRILKKDFNKFLKN